MLTDKPNEISTLIGGENYSQAQDECSNLIAELNEHKNRLVNIRGKCIDKFGADELFEDFLAVINTI